MTRTGWILGVGAVLLGLTAAVFAQDGLDAEVRRISDQLRCPTCQGISVNDSEAAFSVQIRQKVRRMLQEGQNDEQIRDYFVSRYGEWILRAPKKEGLGLVLWLLPGVVLLVFGGWILRRTLRQAGGADNVGEAPQAGLTTEQSARIEKDMRRFEEGV